MILIYINEKYLGTSTIVVFIWVTMPNLIGELIMATQYNSECNTSDLVNYIMSALSDDIDIENSYEANTYGYDNDHSEIIHTLYDIGASPKFVW
jgi:hypothetical protein